MILASLLFWLGVAASVVGIVGMIVCEYRTAKAKRDAEDLAAVDSIIEGWRPHRHSERNRFGQYRKVYCRFRARSLYDR